MMHIQANNDYQINNFVYNSVISKFGNFVFLFMMISSFGMCCGYYDKVISGDIKWNEFYKKRYIKILPFFSFLVLIDVLMDTSINSLYEGFADITLLFGFLPNAGNISVIGVGWFLGLIFVFYLIFPFFCTLLQSKKKAWTVFVISIIYNIACTNYFNVGKTNILYCGMFFIAGGLIYLYKDEIQRLNKLVLCLLTVLGIVLFCTVNDFGFVYLFASTMLILIALAIGGGYSKINSLTLYRV